MIRRAPDFVIMQQGQPYIRRWWIIPRNRFFNIYLHHILRSDDDRALHDHPWWNLSIILKGGYWEFMPKGLRWRTAGDIVLRRPRALHRLELLSTRTVATGHTSFAPCWSLFITGPRVREWGFQCPKGWTHWREFLGIPTGNAKGHEVGPGCGEA